MGWEMKLQVIRTCFVWNLHLFPYPHCLWAFYQMGSLSAFVAMVWENEAMDSEADEVVCCCRKALNMEEGPLLQLLLLVCRFLITLAVSVSSFIFSY